MENTFNEIYDRTYDKILKRVIYKIDDLSTVEDVMQSIYLNLYNTLQKKGPNYIEDIDRFLYKIAKTEIYKHYKLKNKLKINYIDDYSLLESESTSDFSIEEESSIINRLTSDEIWLEIKKERIEVQKILAFYYLQGLKINEISDLVGLNENTVKSTLYRSIKKIKTRIGEKYEKVK